jgi:hypothetical protein
VRHSGGWPASRPPECSWIRSTRSRARSESALAGTFGARANAARRTRAAGMATVIATTDCTSAGTTAGTWPRTRTTAGSAGTAVRQARSAARGTAPAGALVGRSIAPARAWPSPRTFTTAVPAVRHAPRARLAWADSARPAVPRAQGARPRTLAAPASCARAERAPSNRAARSRARPARRRPAAAVSYATGRQRCASRHRCATR